MWNVQNFWFKSFNNNISEILVISVGGFCLFYHMAVLSISRYSFGSDRMKSINLKQNSICCLVEQIILGQILEESFRASSVRLNYISSLQRWPWRVLSSKVVPESSPSQPSSLFWPFSNKIFILSTISYNKEPRWKNFWGQGAYNLAGEARIFNN